MKPGAASGRRAPALGGPAALLAFSLLVLVLTACGISLGANNDETEIFKRLTVEGDFRPGGSLSLTLEYAQPYPVAVNVQCDLLEPKRETTATPSATTTPANGGTPTPVTIPRVGPTPSKKVLDILERTLDAVATPQAWSPTAALAVRGTIKGGFSAPERPGRYVVRCFTPQDDNNAISESITIAPASTPTP